MATLSDTLLTAAGLLGLGASAVPARAEAETRILPDDSRGRIVSTEGASEEDPFFLEVAEALREAGYLDS